MDKSGQFSKDDLIYDAKTNGQVSQITCCSWEMEYAVHIQKVSAPSSSLHILEVS